MAEEGLSDISLNGSFPEGIILGHYRLEWFIGRNSTGEMYSALDVESNKSCSLTVVYPSVSKHAPEIAGQLLRKAQEACFFCHENFIRITDSFSLENCHCIVTEYFKGESADQFVLRGAVSESQVLDIASQLASLLSAAEKGSALVPDFTPDSLFFAPQGKIRIFYPGFKTFLHRLPGQVIASERRILEYSEFIAPELLLGTRRPGPRSAIYSLGRLMCYLLCAGTPRAGANICQSIGNVIAASECDIGPLAPQVSAKTVELIKLMTDKDPDKRLASGTEVLKKLGRKPRSQKNFRRWFFAAAAGILFCGAAAGTFYWCRQPSQREKLLNELDVNSPKTVTGVKESRTAYPSSSAGAGKGTAQRALAAPELRGGLTIDERLEYCRSRLQQLQRELDGGGLPPGIIQLHKKRMEFRWQQITALSARRDFLEIRKRNRQEPKVRAANEQVRRAVEAYLKPYTSRRALMQHRFDLMRRKKSPLPGKILQNQDLDLDMPVAVSDFYGFHGKRERKNPLTLRMVLLNGLLMPEPEALKLLAGAGAVMKGVNPGLIFFQSRNKRVTADEVRWLVRETDQGKSRFSSLDFIDFNGTPYAYPEETLKAYLLSAGQLAPLSLHKAVSLLPERPGMVEMLLEAEAPLEHADKTGKTPLFYAYMSGARVSCNKLLAAGADPKRLDNAGRTPDFYRWYGELFRAIANNDLELAQKAVENEVDLNYRFPWRKTYLEEAVHRGDPQMVAFLLQKGADANIVQTRGKTLLSRVFMTGKKSDPEIFKLLIEYNADVNISPVSFSNGATYMSELIRRFYHPQAAAFAEIMLASGKFKTKPEQLFAICRARRKELFQVAVKYWPDIDMPAYKNLLLEALRNKMSVNAIKTLVERKAPMPEPRVLAEALKNWDSEEVRGIFADILPAAQKHSAPTVKKNVRQNQKKENTKTASPFGVYISDEKLKGQVLRAIRSNSVSVLEQLLKKKKLSPDAVVDELTLLQHAAVRNSVAMVSMLLKYKADPFKVSRRNLMPPVILAVERNSAGAFSKLVRCKITTRSMYARVMGAVVRNLESEVYLNEYLHYHGKEVRELPVCFLSAALRENEKVPVWAVVRLLDLYGTLEAPRHSSVVHQAVAGGYSEQILNQLLRRKANVNNKAPVWVRRANYKGRSMLMLTALETAVLVHADLPTYKILRAYGAK